MPDNPVQATTRGATCPVCGYDTPIWLDSPPTGCLEDGSPQICRRSRTQAHGEAMRRKVCPDAFDAAGKILPGQIARVLRTMHASGLNGMTGYPLEKRNADGKR